MKTEIKSHIAVMKAKLRLLEQGYFVFESDVDYRLPYDFIISDAQGMLKKIQVKYSTDGVIVGSTGYQSLKENRHKMVKYVESDFDYYALYLPTIDKVVFPSVKFAGKSIADTVRDANTPFYWYEDFLALTDVANKRTCYDFGHVPTFLTKRKGVQRPDRYKVQRPTKDQLERLLWEMPTVAIGRQYGVSDNAVTRWVKDFKIEKKPPRGYWQKKHAIQEKMKHAGNVEIKFPYHVTTTSQPQITQ